MPLAHAVLEDHDREHLHHTSTYAQLKRPFSFAALGRADGLRYGRERLRLSRLPPTRRRRDCLRSWHRYLVEDRLLGCSACHFAWCSARYNDHLCASPHVALYRHVRHRRIARQRRHRVRRVRFDRGCDVARGWQPCTQDPLLLQQLLDHLRRESGIDDLLDDGHEFVSAPTCHGIALAQASL